MSSGFIKFSWLTLVFILLVTLAGSVVRTTGAGMGCPDWPTCFGRIVPPTSADQLPENYRDIYGAYRKKKVEKFARLLNAIGFAEEAEKLVNDPELEMEQPFNAGKTWTEYVNRLVGFVAGNLVLITLIWVVLKYRSNRKLVWLSLLNLILMGFEAWFGSIVVATNLVPWTITIHMFMALIIVIIQVRIIRIARNRTYTISFSKLFKYLYYTSLTLTFVQIVLGSQVRQQVDFMVKETVSRSEWIAHMPGDFLFHRSFSWILLLINAALFWLNKREHYGLPVLKWIMGLLVVEFVTGILFSYAGMPALGQPVHFLTAALIMVLQLVGLEYLAKGRRSGI